METKNNDGDTLLHSAAISGNPALIIKLLKKGFNINEQNINGETPLMRSVKCDRGRFMIALLEAGADPDIKDNEGKTALDIAEELGLERRIVEFKKAVEKYKVIKAAKEKKAAEWAARKAAKAQKGEKNGKKPFKKKPGMNPETKPKPLDETDKTNE